MIRAPMLMHPHRLRPLPWCTLTMILLLSAGNAAAVDVGTVVAASGDAEIARNKTRFAAAPDTSISVGDELRTGSPGQADFGFFARQVTAPLVGEEAAAIVSSLTITDNSLAVVDQYDFDPRGPKARFLLMRGRASALAGEGAAGYDIQTPTAIAHATGTMFVVTYDPAVGTTQVVGLSGELRVAGLAGGEVLVKAREITTVAKGKPPSRPRSIGEKELAPYVEGLQFIGGGRPESLTVESGLRQGTEVLEPDRFVFRVGPAPSTSNPCGVLPSTPSCATGEPTSGFGGLDIDF